MIDSQSEQFINKNSLIPNKEISEKTAKDKLNILMDDNFKEYGIRFVNVGEYRMIMKTGKLESREVKIYEGERAPSFKKYLNYRKQKSNDPFYWPVRVEKSTDWHVGILHMEAYRELIDLLQVAHSEAQSATENTKIRGKTIEIFRSSLLGLLTKEEIDLDVVRGSLLRYKLILETNKLNQKDIERIGEKNIDIMKKFFNTTDANYLREHNGLRSFIHAIAYYPFIAGKQDDERSYHMGLIFDIKAISDETTWGKDFWRILKTEKNIGYNLSNHLLGVIVTMPDRKLVQEVVNLSANAGKMSHAVFDNRTNIRYP